MRLAHLIIYASPNGRDSWVPVKPEDVPSFVLEPKVMGRLVGGEMACDAAVGDKGSLWYRAQETALPSYSNH